MLKLGQTAAVVARANKGALGLSAEITAGNILNARVSKIAKKIPNLPIMVKMGLETEIGEMLAANAVAAALIHTMPQNKRVIQAADCMMKAAALKAVASFNIEGMVDELLDGVMLPQADTAEGE